jgi:transcriptional regulator with PAS, ATPase and Fis domain
MQNIYNLVNKYTGMRARYTFEDIVGEDRKMKTLIEYAKNVSDSPSTILISGESGTGKEILAQAIHNFSSRRNKGFVAINCGAIPQNLIESELFGYAEGAFTGAKRGGNPGKFELANGGTLFLDEIDEMPLDMQVRLLRVLQEGCISRVGGDRYINVDVRIIAATNRDLPKEVREGKFREDLFYRISVIPIKIPPLRERREDIPLLIEHFLRVKALKINRKIPHIKKKLYEKMLEYDWKGNIRELENFVENIVNLNGRTTFNIDEFPMDDFIDSKGYNDQNSETVENDEVEEEYICSLEELEKKAIINCIKKFDSNITKCAQKLGISRNTLYLKMKKYDI